jgi:small-conductance mechanosensitive channel
MRTSGRWWIWLLSFVLVALIVLEMFGSLPERLLGGLGIRVRHQLHAQLFLIGHKPVTLFFILQIGIFIVALGLISRFAMSILERRVMRHTSLAASQQYAVSRILSYLIFLLGMLIGLESLGLNLSSLVVVGGALGLGVGLGLQTIVSNFVAGLILLVEQPVRLGDRINVGGLLGDIIAIKGRSTWVRTNENVVIIVPNSEFIEKQVTNWTANDRRVRLSVQIGVSYDSDPKTIQKLLLKEAADHEDVLQTPSPDVMFLGYGDSTINFELRVWTERHVQTPTQLKSDLYFAIFEACRQAGVEIAFPQRDLHIRSISPEAASVWMGRAAQNKTAPEEDSLPAPPLKQSSIESMISERSSAHLPRSN